jgi:hypothetical protein
MVVAYLDVTYLPPSLVIDQYNNLDRYFPEMTFPKTWQKNLFYHFH